MYRYKFPLGDYSRDYGLGSEDYLIESNKHRKHLFPFFEKVEDTFQFSKECTENNILSEGFVAKAQLFGIDIDEYRYGEALPEYINEIDSDDYVRLLLVLLQYFDETLEIKLIAEKTPYLTHSEAQGYGFSMEDYGHGFFR